MQRNIDIVNGKKITQTLFEVDKFNPEKCLNHGKTYNTTIERKLSNRTQKYIQIKHHSPFPPSGTHIYIILIHKIQTKGPQNCNRYRKFQNIEYGQSKFFTQFSSIRVLIFRMYVEIFFNMLLASGYM